MKESSHFELHCSDETEDTESRGSPGTTPGTVTADGGSDPRRRNKAAQAQERFLRHNEPDRRDRRRQYRLSLSVLPEQTRDLCRPSRAPHRPGRSHYAASNSQKHRVDAGGTHRVANRRHDRGARHRPGTVRSTPGRSAASGWQHARFLDSTSRCVPQSACAPCQRVWIGNRSRYASLFREQYGRCPWPCYRAATAARFVALTSEGRIASSYFGVLAALTYQFPV